ncbi:MAG: ferredoxin, partial [Nitrospinaceae bacterium]|nr:ferredoxin [Nitrospinaceae bacterium]NIR55224.1 ferredoxin [Nitrospinaceae bacterium]NIS85651.1 ferredoxin [Nitrospinaceae bacterium]NIT82496.1 ferredoxin [Nitrospinaceae bacterium]NIU44701.1 ferredoxin [Nitrospinaceae bacterium]
MPKVTAINTETGETQTFKLGYGGNLRQAAIYHGVEVYKGINKYLNCRGMGMCGKCLVEIEPMENVDPQSLIEKLHQVQSNQ